MFAIMRGLHVFTDTLHSDMILFSCHGRIAQSVEQRIENPRVAGSIPAPATSI